MNDIAEDEVFPGLSLMTTVCIFCTVAYFHNMSDNASTVAFRAAD